MRSARVLAVCVSSAVLCVSTPAAKVLSAVELKVATLAAFERYVSLTEARIAGELAGHSPFLWLDRQAATDRTRLRERIQRGEVITARLETRPAKNAIEVEGGLIHHWVGTVLLPGAQLDRVLPIVQDYARYPTFFAPTIQRARITSRRPDHFDVTMRTWAKHVIEVVVDADYSVDYRRLGPSKLYTKSVASNLFDVQSPSQPNEYRRPIDETSGLLWRLITYCSFEERPEGTYEQCESISLTRGIPWGLRFLIAPFVTGIPRDTLEFTLGRIREVVQESR